MEFAPHWLHETCENEDEDWGEEDQSVSNLVMENLSYDTERSFTITIRSAIGTSIDATNTESMFPSDNINRLVAPAPRQHLGYFSRFLILALHQLKTKHELRETITGGAYITKHERHSVSLNSSLIRKIYITPSTVLYEGPYQEERCVVTRHFGHVQNGFIRVSFRDEGQ